MTNLLRTIKEGLGRTRLRLNMITIELITQNLNPILEHSMTNSIRGAKPGFHVLRPQNRFLLARVRDCATECLVPTVDVALS